MMHPVPGWTYGDGGELDVLCREGVGLYVCQHWLLAPIHDGLRKVPQLHSHGICKCIELIWWHVLAILLLMRDLRPISCSQPLDLPDNTWSILIQQLSKSGTHKVRILIRNLIFFERTNKVMKFDFASWGVYLFAHHGGCWKTSIGHFHLPYVPPSCSPLLYLPCSPVDNRDRLL